jgi:hypothetical protein
MFSACERPEAETITLLPAGKSPALLPGVPYRLLLDQNERVRRTQPKVASSIFALWL